MHELSTSIADDVSLHTDVYMNAYESRTSMKETIFKYEHESKQTVLFNYEELRYKNFAQKIIIIQ